MTTPIEPFGHLLNFDRQRADTDGMTKNHDLDLCRTGDRLNTRFWGKCACGEASPSVIAAGMVHGWHAEHRDAVGDLIVRLP